MREESTTPDLVELVRQSVDAVNRRDFDAVMNFYAPDAIWDALQAGFGIFEGAAAIRNAFEDWVGPYEEYEQEIVENRDLGNGVVFTVARFYARPAGSTGRVQDMHSWTGIWVVGVCVHVVARRNIDEARAAAERLAQEQR
jgi:ketosteroid isomerase-like protein